MIRGGADNASRREPELGCEGRAERCGSLEVKPEYAGDYRCMHARDAAKERLPVDHVELFLEDLPACFRQGASS